MPKIGKGIAVTKDFAELIKDQHNVTLAVAKIVNVFQEGLNDTIHMPEVHSEAAEAAHYFLGCTRWAAMLLLADLINDSRTNDATDAVLVYLGTILQDHLVSHASHVVNHAGPIGDHLDTCGMNVPGVDGW